MRRQAAPSRGQRESHEIALQPRQDDLRLRVAEAGVELECPDACVRQHQPGVEHAAKLVAGRGQLRHRGPHDALDNLLDERVIDPEGRRVGAHASGVGALVALERSLVVAGGCERHDVRPIGDGEQRKLRSFEPLLDHDLLPASPKALLDEHGVDCLFRILGRPAYDHALAASEAVGLDGDAA